MTADYPKYRFELHPKKKGVCPQCGQRNKFRFFENIQTGERLSQEFGRCDRINSCGYFNPPSYDIARQSKSVLPKKYTAAQKFVEFSVVKTTLRAYNKNHLSLWLVQTFGKEKANNAIQKYRIGTGKLNTTIFWFLDDHGKICNGKQMLYDHSGHRNKSYYPKYLYTLDSGYKTCLFGLHLLTSTNQNDIVCIVESEKTALVGSIYRPDLIWLATGGSNGLTDEKTKALRNRKIILIPDLDKAGRNGFGKKQKTLELLNCQTHLLDLDPSRSDSTDIADIIINNLKN